ncbi:ATP-dependent 6-phosphofructokinase [Corticibacter populi]|uniref:ATP-dependent 6-phosphofructokinase n=1 Tax=Corticibacter populi TaxID=1550736 RepID=A0A3M6R2G9_9BURK|nr:ATP-dependent 6-phosphofructokinase [Corticibacter populi]RMX08942.1 ATP-dependent 6-phosphofructokinase [Corticibacter populi]
MHVGVLTGGGDCPGLNAVIRAVTQSLIRDAGARVTGIERGFLGLIERRVQPLDSHAVSGILHQGGTILGAHNAADPFHWPGNERGGDVSADVLAYARELGLDALVVIGGDGTMRIAHRFQQLGLPVVGVPKTIDNDLLHTERSFGFDSAVAVVAEALQRLETTARSHRRVMVLETMGRYAGWIALEGGLAGGADAILLPELPYDLQAIATLCHEREAEAGFTLICIAEGAHPAGGAMTVQAHLAHSPDPVRLGGVGEALRAQLQPLLASEVRSTQLGHVQRGGQPTAFDRVLSTRFGCHAAEMVARREFGRMVVLRGDACTSVPLSEVAGGSRRVPPDHPLLRAAASLGISLGRPCGAAPSSATP